MLKYNKKEIPNIIRNYQREGRNLIHNVVQLVYFMRGAISYTEMMNMTLAERQIIEEFIQKRLKDESKNPYPNY